MGLKRILFICGSLEPGRDGVGDYTRELAGALTVRGVECKIIAIKDREVCGILKESQSTRGREVSVTRLSKSVSRGKRKREYQLLATQFKPDFISLQYVPYAYSPKGIPITLAAFLKLDSHFPKWHIMVHEAYIGANANFKSRITQSLQIKTIKTIVKKLNPLIIHTTVPGYQAQLASIGIKSEILGLFGNIPVSITVSTDQDDKAFRGVYFGAPPKEDKFQIFINAIKDYLQETDDMMELFLSGQSGEKGKQFASALRDGVNSNRFRLIEKGRMDIAELSDLFLKMDFAIARIPPHLLGKSGSAIALLEHGLPLWLPLAKSQDEIKENFDFRTNQCFVDLFEIKKSDHNFKPSSRLEEIAESFKRKLFFNEDIVT